MTNETTTQINYVCDYCKTGDVRFTGLIEENNKYVHICRTCYNYYEFDIVYPILKVKTI
jgi:transcription elongation factor Elf1